MQQNERMVPRMGASHELRIYLIPSWNKWTVCLWRWFIICTAH